MLIFYHKKYIPFGPFFIVLFLAPFDGRQASQQTTHTDHQLPTLRGDRLREEERLYVSFIG